MTSPVSGPARLSHLATRQPAMVDALESLVVRESPSNDPVLLERCAAFVAELGADATGAVPQIVRVDSKPHLEWRFGSRTRVALIGHFDTVWPAGTIDRWPFSIDGDRATGPGAFDMKAGIVQLFEALDTLDDLSGLTILLTSDEELGSLTSRHLVEAAAGGASAALVLEPSAGGALKIARKGTGMYTLRVTGRAAHAGLEPEKGANALIEAAHLVLATAQLGRPDLGTTVTPTMAAAGSATNVVPSTASVELDVRVAVSDEAGRVDRDVHNLRTTVAGTSLAIEGGPNRPPMPQQSSAEMFALAQACAAHLGLGMLSGVSVGGGSDGNFTAGLGVPTLDGLGAVGDGAHAEGEYVNLSAMPARAALLAEMIDRLLRR